MSGDEEFVYEEEDGEGGGQGGWSDIEDGPGPEDETRIEIENMYYQAKDLKTKNPVEAIEMFETVVQLEAQRGDEIVHAFKSLENIIVLGAKKNLEAKVSTANKQLLKMMNKVNRNDATDSINNILDTVAKLDNEGLSTIIYEQTMGTLKDTNLKLWENFSLKLAKNYLDAQKFSQLEKLCDEMKDAIRNPDGSLDEKRGSPIDIVALEIQMYTETRNTKKLKRSYLESKKVQGGIADPRIMAIIRECGGKMYMGEGNWVEAQKEMFEAFKNYQEGGNMKAKTVLKYVVLASILAQSIINPLHSQEAKVYKDDPEIIAMMRLRSAYEIGQIKEIIAIVNDRSFTIFNDPTVKMYLGDLLRNIRLKILTEKIRPYQTVSLDFLARELKIVQKDLFSLLVELILDEKIEGKIDQINGFLEIKSGETEKLSIKKHDALGKLARALVEINSEIIEKAKF